MSLLTPRARYEPYLWCHAPRLDQGELESIGFFDDGLTEYELDNRLNKDRWVTPTHHLGQQGVVLVTTGAFSPFHDGHLRMMEIARKELEAQGRKVAGAYVCPDHDGYVSAKAGGAAACAASERVHQIQLALKDHPWIQVDPWAALYQDRPLNYTSIVARLQRKLDGHPSGGWSASALDIVYVFGSDNAGFKRAFEDPADYVCVGRPGFSNPHVDAIPVSSTMVRGAPMVHPLPTDDSSYLIRNDLEWATASWATGSGTALTEACNLFLDALHRAIACSMGGRAPFIVSAEDQRASLKGITQPYVSFDKVTANTPASISRVFQFGGLQDKPVEWLTSGLDDLTGDCLFVDDDIASGSTLREVVHRAPNVNWVDSMSLSPKGFDIVDARDFLFGAKAAGLWVKDGEGDPIRAPYLTPWVNLLSRASIPPAAQPAFAQAVLAANVAFFSQIPVTAGETDNLPFWRRLGYQDTASMLTIAKGLQSWMRA